ncbi:hypothetical protein M3Y98_00021100 [Aphelenchoides besseyi]|nr:hypothetical protein M3Y98_00021100 [Aphelenchoides besseyi]KAI6199253.1 hypothetical protein M3Y96_00607100 [Aphelenchoides besseyi]
MFDFEIMAKMFIDYCVDYLPYLELFIGIPCIIINIYFALRFSQLSIISPNLRVLLVATNLHSALVGILHPITKFIPEDSYSIAKGNVAGAFLFYAVVIVNYVSVFVLDLKFIMILAERRLAFNHRSEYEHRGSTEGIQMLLFGISLGLIAVMLRILCILFTSDSNIPVDQLLRTIFKFEQSLLFFITVHIPPLVSSVVGIYEHVRLKRLTKLWKYRGQTLSESFQIRQTAEIVHVLAPLLYVFVTLTCCSIVSYSLLVYIHYFAGYAVESPLYVAISNFDWLCASSYTFFSTVLMMHRFEALRRVIHQDFCRIFSFQYSSERVGVNEVSKKQATDEHFEYLNSIWKVERPLTARV